VLHFFQIHFLKFSEFLQNWKELQQLMISFQLKKALTLNKCPCLKVFQISHELFWYIMIASMKTWCLWCNFWNKWQGIVTNFPSMLHLFKINMAFPTNKLYACCNSRCICSWYWMSGKMEFSWPRSYPFETKMWIFSNGWQSWRPNFNIIVLNGIQMHLLLMTLMQK